MKKFKIALATTAVAAFAMTNVVQAAATNVRPLAFNSGSLQTVFDNITTAGPGIDVNADQSAAAVFGSDASGGAVATFIIEIAGNASSNTFGIYEFGNSANTAEIFSGADTAGSQVLVSFLANGDIEVNGSNAGSGFNGAFGFYLGVGGTPTFYTEDSENADGNAQAMIYQGDGSNTLQIVPFMPGSFASNEFIIAFEDLVYAQSDKDFNDLVVMVESITPVPAPAAMLLGAMGLGMVGWVRKRVK